MLGTDDGDEEFEPDYDNLDLDELASEAEADSVTASRLRGDELYFPDCRPFLQEGQQPQHLILLTTSGDAFTAEGMVYQTNRGFGDTHTSLSASSAQGGVVIATQSELLVVVDDSFVEVPLAHLQGLIRSERRVDLFWSGNKPLRFRIAQSADECDVFEGISYLRQQIKAASSG